MKHYRQVLALFVAVGIVGIVGSVVAQADSSVRSAALNADAQQETVPGLPRPIDPDGSACGPPDARKC
jgi:hypothetical protein